MKKLNYTVLYVEDEDGVRVNTSEFLRYQFQNVIEAKDGKEAYLLYKSLQPDFIITDIKMPKLNGIELVQKIRDTDNDTPIIVTSAHSCKESLFSAIKLNLVDYIVKPIDRQTLKDALNKAVAKICSTKYCTLDPLTSLNTRSILDLKFNNIIQNYEENNEQSGAIFIDIDNFKTINDTLGHQFGDKIIKKVSLSLSDGVRKNDIVIRWGGDEFLILILDTSKEKLKKIANNLKDIINSIVIDGFNSITCSFGIDLIKHNDTIDNVIERIDKALLSAKKQNKNVVIEYSEVV